MFLLSARAAYIVDPRQKFFQLSSRDIKRVAKRYSVEKEFVWLYVGGRLYAAQNVEDEKENIGVDHYALALESNADLRREYPRGFVTFDKDGKIEIQTYGKSFWEMPTKVQNLVEAKFDIKPGQYTVGPVLEMPPQFKSVMV